MQLCVKCKITLFYIIIHNGSLVCIAYMLLCKTCGHIRVMRNVFRLFVQKKSLFYFRNNWSQMSSNFCQFLAETFNIPKGIWNEHIYAAHHVSFYVVVLYLVQISNDFYAPQLVPAGTAEARISYGNSVRPSVCHDPVVYQAQVR